MASIEERIISSLADLQRKLDRHERREAERRADSEARARRVRREEAYQDRVIRQASFSSLQSRIDSLLEPYGVRAPAPRANQSARSYKIELLRMLQERMPPYSDHEVTLRNGHKVVVGEIARFPFARCDDNVVDLVGDQLEQVAEQMAFHPASTVFGEMRERKRRGPTGADVTEFIGTRSFVTGPDYAGPVIRAGRINDPTVLAAIAKGLVKL
jgi:hypothetical protein